ncbi:MAG TPA: MBL fold metallo-hydrolase [Burkholderiales bacterium]|nr:MBL fold metallo-hydrolase [Burkholderiales bacterium]
MARTRFEVGAICVDRVVEFEQPLLDPLEIYPEASAADIASQMSWLAPRFYDPATKLLVVPIQGFVVRAGSKVLVVDTCAGDCKPRKRPHFNQQRRDWIGKLAAIGVAPEKVDYVLLTHFHADHVGWNTRLEDGRWVPAFPNARYLFTREEWDYWSGPQGAQAMERTGDYMVDSVVPIVEAGRADFIPMDHSIFDEVRLIPAAGHTPGFVCVDVRSSGRRLVLASDLLHSPLQCAYPEWTTRFCADPQGSVRTRVRLLSEWAKSRVEIMPTHFPSPSAGFVERKNGAFSFRYTEETPSRSR